ncbi:hypothetical protein A8B84_12025 [Marinobacter sp. EhC06]|jgi:ATP/maltotriose-dependent transcriptional regulator MalT|uniref:LuxR C-terminal-related transcriptional regulator n=1 Tax=Marinobacter TaxID=2742 RepID=UPI0007D99F8D|nr:MULTISPECIES: LuxR C-terminal-related transcriptional regulator [unclassified Marinobacter]OAN87179.1 hypothetical protein A8B80_10385 [Marinobacter sp. EhN04]OAN89478.1 hypothetical protein A8B84_12025 [Marinobacter sp. EhC06]
MNNEYQNLPPGMTAKLSPPARWGYDLLERPHLLERILTKQPIRLILISAAAGYGKSTLMAQVNQVLQQHHHVTAWLTLDKDDNDPVRLYTHLFLALQNDKKASPQLPEPTRITRNHASRLASLMTEVKAPTVLFIDEFENLANPDSQQLIYWLLNYLPSGCRIVIASRTRPAWDLSKLSMQGELIELHEPDLKLSGEEAAKLTELHGSTRIDQKRLDILVEKTEGWLAGVRLALLCHDNWDNNFDWISALSGEIEQIADFLYEQVFRQLETEQQLFLMKVSILNRMTAGVCEALTLESGAQTQIQSLCRRGLFIQAIDPQRKWFRMHGLMRQFLCNRLKQQMPKQYGLLNETAARWFANNHSRIEAVHYAITANNPNLALEILEDVSKSLIEKGQLRTLSDLAKRAPDRSLAGRYQLIAKLCLAHLLMHELEDAQRYMSMLEPLISRSEVNKTLAEMPILEPLLIAAEDDMVRAAKLARHNQSNIPSDQSHFEQGVLSNIIAFAELGRGNSEICQSYTLQGRASHLEADSALGLAYADMITAMRVRSKGNLQLAREISGNVGLGPDYHQMGRAAPNEIGKGVVNGFEVDLLYELNELAMAESLLAEYAHLGRENVSPDIIILGFLTAARVAFVKGNKALAYSRVDEGEIAGLRRPLPRLVQSMRLQRARFKQLEGKHDVAKAYLNDIAMTPMNGDPSKIAYMDPVTEWVALDLIPLRQNLQEGDTTKVWQQLPPLIEESGARPSRQIQVLLLKAECLSKMENQDAARQTLTEAIDLGLTYGFIRTFADSGRTIIDLLKSLYQEWANKPAPCFRERRGYCLQLLEAANEAVIRGPSDETTLAEPLSDRELQTLTLVGDGLKNEQIAEQLFLSVNTVKWHLRRAYEKLDVRSRTEAIAEARRRNFIQ